MFVSVRRIPICHQAFQSLTMAAPELPGQPLWATTGHPEGALGDGKKWQENHSDGSVSDVLRPFEAIRRPHEGRRWPHGHGRYYKIKEYRIKFNTLKYLPIRVENPANSTPEVTLLQSMSFISLFFVKVFLLKFKF